MSVDYTSLASLAPSAFLKAMTEIWRTVLGKDKQEQLQVLKAAIDRISSKEVQLSESERGDRISRLLSDSSILRETLHHIASGSKSYSPSVKNAIARSVPEEFRRYVYSKAVEGEKVITSTPTEVEAQVDDPLQDSDTSAFVLLLSKNDQQANQSLLKSNHLVPLTVIKENELDKYMKLYPDICGFFIDPSFFSTTDKNAIKEILRKIAFYSSLTWICVAESDENNLTSQAEVRSIIQKAQMIQVVPSEQLDFTSNRNIRQTQIPNILIAKRLLAINKDWHVVPDDFDDNELALIMSAAHKYEREHRRVSEIAVSTLRTRSLFGGRTSAKVFSLKLGTSDTPVVAKLDKKDRIHEEIERFNRYIIDWDDRLRPTPYFHFGNGIILFSLVPDADDARVPAPSLEHTLVEIWNNELWSSDADASHDLTAANLSNAIARATKRLSVLNKKSCPAGDLQSLTNPNLQNFIDLKDSGVTWGFPKEAFTAIDKACARYKQLAGKCIVHGDVQLRDLLVRGDHECYFIDYACSGPGHPAWDLSRLELALYLGCFRQVADDETHVAFQKALSLSLVSEEDLRSDYGEFFNLRVNDICLKGCISARDRVLEVLAHWQGAKEDYLVAKYLIAWTALGLPDQQTGLARSVILAFADEIASWQV